MPIEESGGEDVCVVLFSNRGRRYGLIVDGFHGEQDLVVRPLDARLGKVPNVSAAAILDDGSPVLIVDLDDLHRSIEKLLHEGHLRRAAGLPSSKSVAQAHPGRRRFDHGPGSRAAAAVRPRLRRRDGRGRHRGLELVREGHFDLVVTDIDMPRMNGIELVRRIKAEPRLQSIPVVIVSYKDRQEDRRQGLEAGANFYLTKSSFHDDDDSVDRAGAAGPAESAMMTPRQTVERPSYREARRICDLQRKPLRCVSPSSTTFRLRPRCCAASFAPIRATRSPGPPRTASRPWSAAAGTRRT